MKRTLVGALIVLVLLLLAAPALLGWWGQSRFEQMLEQAGQAGWVKFTVIKVERGWFRSHSTVLAEASGDLAASLQELSNSSGGRPQAFEVNLHNTLHHGPIAWGTGSWSPSLAVLTTELAEASGQPLGQMDIETRLAFSGGGTTHVEVPAVRKQSEGGDMDMEWQGLDAELEFSRDFADVELELESPGLRLVGQDARVDLDGLELEMELEEAVPDLMLGEVELSVDAVHGASFEDDQPKFRLNGLKLEAVAELSDEKTMQQEMGLRIDTLQFGAEEFGPMIYDLALRNLDTEAMVKLNRTVRELQQQEIPEEQRGMMAGFAIMSILPQLLERQPAIEIDEISLDSPHGKAQARGVLKIQSDNPQMLQNPFLLKEAVYAEVDASIPESLLVELARLQIANEARALGQQYSEEQLRSMARVRVRSTMQSAEAARFFYLADDTYYMELRAQGGQLTLNGKSVEVQGLAP